MLRVTRDCRNSGDHGLITFRLTKPPLWGEDLWSGPPNTLDEVRHLGVELIPRKTMKRSRSPSSNSIRLVQWLPRRRDADRGGDPHREQYSATYWWFARSGLPSTVWGDATPIDT